MCFPTYKREYGKQADGKQADGRQAAAYVAAIKGKGAGDPGAMDAIKHLFLEHPKKKGGYEPLYNEERGAWDMGWLDPIGYVIDSRSNSMNITNSVVSCWDCSRWSRAITHRSSCSSRSMSLEVAALDATSEPGGRLTNGEGRRDKARPRRGIG